MAMIASDLRDAISASILNQTQSSVALQLLGDTIASYILENNEVLFSWVATDPEQLPDPTIVANGKLQNITFTLTPSGLSTQATAIPYLEGEFIAGLSASTYIITDSGFSVSPGATSSSPTITTLNLIVSGTERQEVLLQFASKIINWVKAQVPTAPCSGSHGKYVGAGTVTSIS